MLVTILSMQYTVRVQLYVRLIINRIIASTTVYATIPELNECSLSVQRLARGNKFACYPRPHAIIQRVRAQQKVVQGLWHTLLALAA